MRLQYDPSELDDPIAALANLKQTGSAQDFHGAFIKPVHLVDATEKILISLFLVRLKEELRGRVKLENH